MRYIRTRAVAEAIKTTKRSAFLAAKLRPRMADNKEESRSTDISSEAADKVMAAGRKAAGSVTRGKIFGKKKTAMRTRTAGLEAGLDRRSSKWIKTSETAGKNDVRTSETQHTEDLKADRITVQERARGSAAAKKALHVQKQTAAGIRAAAGSAKRIAGKMLRSALRAVNAQNAMIIGGGALAVCAVIIISMVGGIAASPFGIFFSIEEDGGASLRSILSDLSKEFYDPIQQVQRSVPYDILEMESDNGNYGVQWDEILPVWAVYRTFQADENTVGVDEDSKSQLRRMMNDLTSFSYEVTSVEIPLEKDETEKDDESDEEEDEVQEIRTLTIRIYHVNTDRYTDQLGFTEQQNRLLNEITSEKFGSFWAKTAGAYSVGGQILTPYGAASGIFTWPMAIPGSITSGFGYRTDPFTGEVKYHGGIDISAAQGTSVLAVGDGTVTVANGSDPWGGGYGYYVMISHGNGYETLYGHCSAICVVSGQTVQRGEVIAYVGSTGNSTGNHLHFEARINGAKEDPLRWF